jgi:hypothetical protein
MSHRSSVMELTIGFRPPAFARSLRLEAPPDRPVRVVERERHRRYRLDSADQIDQNCGAVVALSPTLIVK